MMSTMCHARTYIFFLLRAIAALARLRWPTTEEASNVGRHSYRTIYFRKWSQKTVDGAYGQTTTMGGVGVVIALSALEAALT